MQCGKLSSNKHVAEMLVRILGRKVSALFWQLYPIAYDQGLFNEKESLDFSNIKPL
jgi:hypothetical protein